MNRNTLTLMSIAGARPNFMKIASITRAIAAHQKTGEAPGLNHILVHTGQHYDKKLSECFFDQLELPRPDVNLEVGSASHAVQTAEIMKRFEPVVLERKPDAIIVVGDVNSTIACALVASKMVFDTPNAYGLHRPLIVHVEAGLRSGDRTMPEEINRILTDAISDRLFVTEEDAISNLQKEGIPKEKIHFAGNVMIDTLMAHIKKARQSNIRQRLGIKNHYGLVTLHRPSNVDDKDKLIALLECLASIAQRIPLYFPVHPRTRANMEKFGILKRIESGSNLSFIEPLGYLDFLNLLEHASIVLTDSGGIQEETTVLGVPCITMRENTERPVTVKIGTNFLVGTDTQKIYETASSVLEGKGKKGAIPPYWDGKAGKRILDTLLENWDQSA